MPTPFGHGLAALALAALVGLDEPSDLASFVGGALLPDGDLVLGLLYRGDPMELHRRFGSHSPLALALAAAGAAALNRRRTRSAALGAAGAAIHLMMDALPWVYVKAESTAARGWPQFLRSVALNSMFDIAILGPLALAAWRWRRDGR